MKPVFPQYYLWICLPDVHILQEDDKPEADKVKQDTHSRSSVHKTSRQFSNEKNPPIFSG